MGDAAGGSPPGGEGPNRRGWRPPEDVAADGHSGSSASQPPGDDNEKPRSSLPPPPEVALSLGTTMPGSVAGQVSAVTATSVQSPNGVQTTVVTFRLEQYDARAGRTGVTTVRLLGDNALGFVTDGDWVEVLGKAKHGFIEAADAVNHTSHAQYSRKGEGCAKAFGYVACAVFAVVFLGVAAFIAVNIISQVMEG